MTTTAPRKSRKRPTTANDYQQFAISTRNAAIPPERVLEFAALEIAGESGEFANMVYKVAFQGHDLEEYRAKMILELGDIMWGLANAADNLGVTLTDVMEANQAKLLKRYGTGHFTVQDSIARVDTQTHVELITSADTGALVGATLVGDPYTWESGE